MTDFNIADNVNHFVHDHQIESGLIAAAAIAASIWVGRGAMASLAKVVEEPGALKLGLDAPGAVPDVLAMGGTRGGGEAASWAEPSERWLDFLGHNRDQILDLGLHNKA